MVDGRAQKLRETCTPLCLHTFAFFHSPWPLARVCPPETHDPGQSSFFSRLAGYCSRVFSTTRSRSWQVYGYFPRRSRPDPRHEQIGATIKVETLGLYERVVDDEFFRRISLVEGRKKAQRRMPRYPVGVFRVSLNTRVFVFAGQDLRASSFARGSMRASQANARRVQVKLNGLIRARPQIIPARLPRRTVSHDIGIRWFCPAPISFPQIDALFVSPNKIAFALLPTNEPL